MKLIVDTNIAFSAILNSTGNIAKILFHSGPKYEFYSCDFLKVEIALHRSKIQRLTKLTEGQVQELINLVYSKISFLDEQLLPKKDLQKAFDLIGDLDKKDLPFVALSIHLKAHLWTGDKAIYRALKKRDHRYIIDTSELLSKIRI